MASTFAHTLANICRLVVNLGAMIPFSSPEQRLVVQCHIPTLAARAIKLETIKRRAREAGILRATIRFARDHVDHPETQVTTHVDVARFLVDRLRAVAVSARRGAGPSKRAVVLACSDAAARLSAAIDAALGHVSVVVTDLADARAQL